MNRRNFFQVLLAAGGYQLTPEPVKLYFFAPLGGWRRSPSVDDLIRMRVAAADDSLLRSDVRDAIDAHAFFLGQYGKHPHLFYDSIRRMWDRAESLPLV